MRALMLVSATAGSALRADVDKGERPRPEYLCLEQQHDVELLDWSRLPVPSGRRSAPRSALHAAVAASRASRFDVVFSDGEHVGVPTALAMHALRIDVPHVILGHHLVTPAKEKIFRALKPQRHIERVIVHSANQRSKIVETLGLDPLQLKVVPYGIDSRFWCAEGIEDEALVVSAGREHRDYRTLVAALPSGSRLAIADHSLYTPQATRRDPVDWPSNVERLALPPSGLRDLYSRASVVVVPVVESTMPAGITTLLEAMAMGKAIVVTETDELRGVIDDGVTGLTVVPGDVTGLRLAIDRLLNSASLRTALGQRAQKVARESYDVDVYSESLARELDEAASRYTYRHPHPPRFPAGRR